MKQKVLNNGERFQFLLGKVRQKKKVTVTKNNRFNSF